MRTSFAPWLLLPLALASCEPDRLGAIGNGTLRLIATGAGPNMERLEVQVITDEIHEASGPVVRPETVIDVEGLPRGLWQAQISALGHARELIQRVTVGSIAISEGRITEVRVELGEPVAPTTECQEGLCLGCDADGAELPLTRDPACLAFDCRGLDRFELRGSNDWGGTSACVSISSTADVGRCAGPGACSEPGPEDCVRREREISSAGLCERLTDCTNGSPSREVAPNGTPCGSGRICDSGDCVPVVPPPPSSGVGCSDGTREGFLSQNDYPQIAGCSGAWSVPGITRPNLAPACQRAGGNDSSNVEGTGCAAADLCADGWHVCLGKEEVAAKSRDGCAGAVPPGAPDKSLLFAVQQNSTTGSRCDDSGNSNDVFGCGNLGTQLTSDKNCAPLDRALASTQPDTCGFNEAEPTLGPWECHGGGDSHLNEGQLVTKNGCPGQSCAYDGVPLGSADKGGVLCCAD